MGDRTKILYVINRMGVGGSQTHLLQVLSLLDRSRFEPILCCLTEKGELLDAVRASGTRMLPRGLGGGLKSLRAVSAAVRLAGRIRRERVEIVHNYLLRANIVGTVAARLAGVSVALAQQARLPRAARARAVGRARVEPARRLCHHQCPGGTELRARERGLSAGEDGRHPEWRSTRTDSRHSRRATTKGVSVCRRTNP